MLVSLNNLAAEGPLHACAKSALHTPQLHETIMVSNLNEMLLLWNQWIDENAARLSISHLGCVFVCARLQACGTTCLSYTLLGAMSLLQHHLFIWQSLLSVTGNMRSEARVARALSLCLCPPTSQINSRFRHDKLRKCKSVMYQCDAIIHHFTWGSSSALW